MGFSNSGDTNRKKFTQYERDTETGLDYAQARYYSSLQGRFTTSDPLMASAHLRAPQTWNRYSYGLNNPLKYVDPSGLNADDIGTAEDQRRKQLENRQGVQSQPQSQQPLPVATQTATAPDTGRCHMCFGQTVAEVKVEQIQNPSVGTDVINGVNQVNVGVVLVYTFTDANGDPVQGTASEQVEAIQGQPITQAQGEIPLVDGKVEDLVSNPAGPVPQSPPTQQQQLQLINKLNQPFITHQRNTITIVPDGGPPVTIIHERNLNNTTPGAPPLANGFIKGYTFTMEKPKIGP